MNEYQQILQQLQKRESDLLEMWDTMNPDSVEDTERAEKLYQKYLKEVKTAYPNLILGGRLGAYRYWDMDVCVKNALELCKKL